MNKDPVAHDAQPVTSSLRLNVPHILGRGDWREEPLPHHFLNPATDSLTLVTDGERRVVRKTLRKPPDGYGVDPAHFDYWAREPSAIQSGILEGCPAPQVFHVESLNDETYNLWMAWAGESLNDPIRASEAIAAVNSRVLKDVPTWGSIGWMRQWVEHQGDLTQVLAQDELWKHPLVAAHFNTFRQKVSEWWKQRETLLALYERLPRCHVHGDLSGPNIFFNVGEVKLIDWGYTREGVRGEDIAHLVCSEQASFATQDVALLAERCLQAYGANDVARQGFVLGCVLRRAFALVRVVTWTQIPNVEEQSLKRFGVSIEALMRNRGQLATYLASLGNVPDSPLILSRY